MCGDGLRPYYRTVISFAALLSIAGVVLLGAVSPGPDFFVLTRRTTTSGRAAGLVCAAGMGTGIFVWVIAVGSGIAALLEASAVAYSVVKLVGATYLIMLGLRAWLSARRGGAAWEPDDATAPQRAVRSFREGLLCNLLNPKVAVFYLAFLPQFLPAGGGWSVTLELAIAAAATVMCWYLVVAFSVASLRRFLTRRIRRAVDAAVGTVLIGLGVRIATT